MAIEFRCSGCQKLLRTQDDTAGKQAKCPQCGMILTVPDVAPPVDPAPPVHSPGPMATPPGVAGTWLDPAAWQARPSPDPFARPSSTSWQSPSGTSGPGSHQYRSADSPLGSGGASSMPTLGRNGPAWERDGPSLRSYIETFQECATDVQAFFATMRRDGGVGAPLGFALVGIIIAVMANTAFEFLQLGAQNFLPGNANAAPQFNAPRSLIGLGCFGGGFFAVSVVSVFLLAGVYHLVLIMLDGAHATFEATYRAVAYSTGITSILQVVPCCGPQIGGLLAMVLTIVGLANLHETTGWKASGAVLIPLVLCCCAGGGLMAAFVGVAVQQQALVGWP